MDTEALLFSGSEPKLKRPLRGWEYLSSRKEVSIERP